MQDLCQEQRRKLLHVEKQLCFCAEEVEVTRFEWDDETLNTNLNTDQLLASFLKLRMNISLHPDFDLCYIYFTTGEYGPLCSKCDSFTSCTFFTHTQFL